MSNTGDEQRAIRESRVKQAAVAVTDRRDDFALLLKDLPGMSKLGQPQPTLEG